MFKAEDVFFFDQYKPKRFETRRAKKYSDDAFSFSGERKEGLVLRPGEKEAADSVSVVTTHTLPGRKVSVAGYGIRLPHIDPQGPNFIQRAQSIPDNTTDVDTKSILSTKKLEQLKEAENKVTKDKSSEEQKQPHGSLYKLSEAKLLSTGVLSKLGKLFEKVCSEKIEVTLPTDLIGNLLQNYRDLSDDAVVEKREWQTDCYKDFNTVNTLPYLTAAPEESEGEAYKSALKSVISHNQQKDKQEKKSRKIFGKKEQDSSPSKQEKRVRMSREAKGGGRGVGFKDIPKTLERPMTARSNVSSYSFRSDYSDEGRDSYMATDYDRLPAELCPTILHYHRESSSLKVKQKVPLTRREKSIEVKKKNAMDKIKKVRLISTITPPKLNRSMSARPKRERPISAKPPSMAGDDNAGGLHMPRTVITFSISTAHESSNDPQGWLVHPSDSADPEAHTLRMWDKKLKELHRKMEESRHIDKKRGADKPLLVKFYNDPQIRNIRMKHQRSVTVPLPAAFSKLPPSIGSISAPGANEVLMLGEGVKAFVLTLPDGSGYCKYPSGRLAVSLSRCDMSGPLANNKGLYTLIFDDCEGSPLLGYFTPLGKACCYHKSGTIKMFSDSNGGALYNENGDIVRKWEWPPIRMSMPVPVHLHLNVQMSVKCGSLTSMDLRVSMRGQSYKFNIASTPEDLLNHHHFTKDLSAGTMSSKVSFASQAAKSRKLEEEVSEKSKREKSSKKNNKKNRHSSTDHDKDTTVNDSLSSLLLESDQYVEALGTYKRTVQDLVDRWMGHYCSTLGIRGRSGISLSRNHSTKLDKGRGSSEGRLVKSSLGYVSSTYYSRPPSTVRVTRSLTHPLNSRASSRPVSSTPTPAASDFKLPTMMSATDKNQLVEDISHRTKDSTSKLSFSQTWHPSSSGMLTEPSSKLKLTSSQPKTTSTRRRAAVGCPVALHKMLVESLPAMPQCKCAKHHVPYIFDQEFDQFLKESVPSHQLIIVCVKSSLKEGSCPYEPLIDSVYCSINKVRFSPCLLASQDDYRLLKYDLDQSVEGEDNQPLLVQRHHVSAGMFMMYMNGALVHADNVFNGYSNTKKDFMKQIDYSIAKGKKGDILPPNFKFSRRTGSRIMRSNTWAYPVSGVMQDLIPFSPATESGASTPQRRRSDTQPSASELLAQSQVTSQSVLEEETEDDLSTSQFSSTSLTPLQSSAPARPIPKRILKRNKTEMSFSLRF